MNERIKKILEELGLKKVEFAERLHISRSYASELCSGAKSPSDRTISDICREFGVSEHWLRTGDGEMFVRLSREEEITKFAMSIVRNPDSEFQRRFVSVLAQLTPEQWQLMEQMAHQLIDDGNKKEGT